MVFSVVPKSIDPTEILVSYSGGKDSTCLLYLLQKRHVAFDRVIFADTGVEYPEVYEFIEQVEKRLGIDIERVHPKVTWDDWFYKNWSKGMHEDKIHGFPPRSGGCWARRELKTNPLKKAMGTGNTIFLGITADESHRAGRNEYQNAKNTFKFPLVEWGITSKKCIQILDKIGLRPPNYQFRKRTGCWMCPQQPQPSLFELYYKHPDLWERLKVYAKDSPFGFGGYLNKPEEWEKRKQYLEKLERKFEKMKRAHQEQHKIQEWVKVTN